MQNIPPNSFWLLIEPVYRTDPPVTWTIADLSLQVGVWHCLPDRFLPAAQAAQETSKLAYQHVTIEIFQQG